MPAGWVRFQHSRNFHFVTFTCYRRLPLLASRCGYSVFEKELETVSQRHGFVVAGYAVIPEHLHCLVSKPRSIALSIALQALKQQESRKLKRPGDIRFWQRRYYDFNAWNRDKTVEKLKYRHRNPVRRGLVATPKDWPPSSFRHYLTGEAGTVEMESHCTAWQREPPDASAAPTLPNP